MVTDLVVLADRLDRLANEATPGPWAWWDWTPGDEPDDVDCRVGTYGDNVIRPTLGTSGVSPRDACLIAWSPSLARSLAAVLRAVADNAGTTDLSHPVLADVLTACEPLLPLIAAPEGTS